MHKHVFACQKSLLSVGPTNEESWETHLCYQRNPLSDNPHSCGNIVETKGPSGARLLAGGPLGLLTSSYAPFGRSGGTSGPGSIDHR